MSKEKPRVREVILVEGRYDKNSLLQVVEAAVMETGGFQIFRDREYVHLLCRLAESRGLIILTDSDGAGFVIRNHLKGMLPAERVKHAYIPDRFGTERRKKAPSAEGKLGVEGMPPEVLLRALLDAGATLEGEDTPPPRDAFTKAELYAWGLSGRPDSAARRRALAQTLDLPERLTPSALGEVLGALYTREELLHIMSMAKTVSD